MAVLYRLPSAESPSCTGNGWTDTPHCQRCRERRLYPERPICERGSQVTPVRYFLQVPVVQP